MSIINVDKKKREDVHYRYKMPSLECKVESGGNGVKVVFSNLPDVCAALHRPNESLLKFLGISRGAQTTFDAKDNKYYMMGNHLTQELQDVVFEYIERFVLCKSCRNPETTVMPGNRSVKMRCGACGKDTSLDQQDDKIVKELVKGSGVTKSETARADTAANAAPSSAPAATVESDIVCVLDLTKEYALPGETNIISDPAALLAEALKDIKNLGKTGVQKRLISIKSEHGFLEDDVPRLIFRGATNAAMETPEAHFIGPLREAAFLFKNQLDSCRSAADKVSSIQDTILSEVVLRVINLGRAMKVPMVLKMLVDESILEPSKVVAFCKNLETNPQVKKKADLPALIDQLSVLVKWLEEGTAKEATEEAAPEEVAPVATKAKKSKKIEV